MADDFILQVRGLSKRFGGNLAVAGVDLDVRRGETLAIIGPNGAGKTTFYNLLSGRMLPTQGQILFNGKDIAGLPPHVISRLGVSRSFQINNIFTEMSVRENVEVAVTARRGEGRRWANRAGANPPVRQEAAQLLEQLSLSHLAEQRAGTISYGDKRLVEIAVVLATQPQLVLLDEPTAGMTPDETGRVVELVQGLMRTGRYTFLITEHDMRVVFDLASRILVLHHGASLILDAPAVVRADPRVREAYLGHADAELGA
ncbi:ABC transporter ATP-binding protein [Castellaniella caeni]|uniref:ABC transporter ATP-binding protein n=1 Tax=Castellaniella caeni TaxID=266123 RepID=UPI00083488A2|nr:ABC transporter ATP-binding protein [Castellaniella caeni]